MKITDIRPNENNPRLIRDEKFKKLVQSIQEFPKMMSLRPIVYDPATKQIIGGNMRYQALVELGYKEIPDNWIKSAAELTEEEKKRFVIEDNVNFGEWDYSLLKDWDKEELSNWGIDVPDFDFHPRLEPEINTKDVTKKDIEKKEYELERQMNRETNTIETICPNCGHVYKIQA